MLDTIVVVDVRNREMSLVSCLNMYVHCRCPGIQASAPFMDACILGWKACVLFEML